MRFAGVDIASLTHVIAIMTEIGKVLVKPTSFGEDAAGYEKAFALLGPSTDVLVVMEATGHYGRNFMAALWVRGYQLALINPIRTRLFAHEDLRRAKNDPIDALGLARFGIQKGPLLPTPPFDEATDQLREFVYLLERLTQDFGDRVRQLHRLIDLGFPEFTRHVPNPSAQRATAILAAYPSAQAFSDSCLRELATLRYDGSHHVGEPLASALIETAKASVGRHHGPAYHLETRYICQDIDRLRSELRQIQQEIERRLAENPVAVLLATIDGLGAIAISRIIAAVGDPARFRSGAALASYVGAVPGTDRSGKGHRRSDPLCPLGNARLRRTLFMTTLGAVRRNPWLGAYYARLRARGKPPKLALLAAMRKLLMAIYSVAKHRKPFVPQLP
jgi:transposase